MGTIDLLFPQKSTIRFYHQSNIDIMKNYVLLFALLINTLTLTANTNSDTTATQKTPTEIHLKEGTRVSLMLADEVTSADLIEGQIVPFEVVKNVYVDGDVIFKEGAYAEGQVIEMQKAGAFGKSGKIVIEILDVETTDGKRVSLYSPPLEFKGKNKKGLAFGISAGVPVIAVLMGGPVTMGLFATVGLFVKGKQAKVTSRQQFTAEIRQNTKIKTKRATLR